LPALITAAGPSRIEIEGGTHNPAAPPFDFLQKNFIPLIERMGPKVKLELGCGPFKAEMGVRFSSLLPSYEHAND
jgi:RNA 3'-terminal phosphate cyclase (ATP)